MCVYLGASLSSLGLHPDPRPAPRPAALPRSVIVLVTCPSTRFWSLDHGMEPTLAGASKTLKQGVVALWSRIRAVGLGT